LTRAHFRVVAFFQAWRGTSIGCS